MFTKAEGKTGSLKKSATWAEFEQYEDDKALDEKQKSPT